MRPITAAPDIVDPMRFAVFTAALLALAATGSVAAEHPTKKAPTAAPQAHAPETAPHAARAKPTLAELASHGDAEAQYQLGLSALEGKGRKGQSEALSWFILGANNHHAGSALRAARIFEQRGNVAMAARWWYRAGELGDVAARARLLDLYLDGKVDNIVGAAGAAWLSERADAGDTRAQLALGDIYEHGRGIAIDTIQAQHWYLTAALDGDSEAMFRLGRLQVALPAVWRVASRETGKDGKWQGPFTTALRPAARARSEDRSAPGRLDLGRQAVAEELNVEPKDLQLYRPGMVEGEHWLSLAARYGHAPAQLALGRVDVEGIDLPLDMSDGIRWLEAAAWQRDPAALMALADLAAKGHGFPAKDPVRAWVDYDLAAARGAKAAEEARDRLGRTLNQRQLGRARQIAQDLREPAL